MDIFYIRTPQGIKFLGTGEIKIDSKNWPELTYELRSHGKSTFPQTMQKLAESFENLAIQMRKLPAPKKEHWQGCGKKRKPQSL